MAGISPTELMGSCACERNQYTILVPASSTSQPQVFFDNSAANRRSQATPLTAWLRVPLAWYHSRTFALFPDETHASIRRVFHTPSSTRHERGSEAGDEGAGRVTRRQFCGYCGTHLSAWDEGQTAGEGEWMDVTLGSLLDESLRELQGLGVLGDSEDEDGTPGDAVAEDDDVGASDVTMSNTLSPRPRASRAPQRMRGRGMPYFESLAQDSRLGRMKRQKGGHVSADGRRTVEWEVVEIDGGGGDEADGVVGEEEEGRMKRPRLEP